MLARVAVATDALDLGVAQMPIVNNVHSTLVRTLFSHGRLVFGSQEEARAFIRAVKQDPTVPPGARTRWEELLAHLTKTGRVHIARSPVATSLAAVSSVADLRAGWGAQADVAVVAQKACSVLGVPEDTGLLTESGWAPDITVPASIEQTTRFSEFESLRRAPLALQGSTRDAFWTAVLAPLATKAVAATVFDAYLFHDLWGLANPSRGPRRKGEAITWLLKHLDEVMAPGATVKLMGSIDRMPPVSTAEAVAAAIHARWAPPSSGRLGRVEVHLARSIQGRKFPHDRHVRFSTGGAMKISAGLDRLREEQVWDRNGMWWEYHWEPAALRALQRAEREGEALRPEPPVFAIRRND